MSDLAKLLKLMFVYTHAAHNLVSRVPFFQDHEFLSETYQSLLEDFDSVVERSIGTLGENSIDLKEIASHVVQRFSALPVAGAKENSTFFIAQLQLEKELCQLIKILTPKVSVGTAQLIGDIANESEVRQYKIQQRLKK